MPLGFGVSTETARSVVKNFKKQRRFYNSPEETQIRFGGKVSDKSEINISNKDQLFRTDILDGFIWTSKSPKQIIVFDIVDKKREVIPYTPEKNNHLTDYLTVIVGNYMVYAYKEKHNDLYNFTLSLRVGDSWVISTENIKEKIIKQFNEDVFIDWKKYLKETTPLGKSCIEIARGLTDRVIASPIKCDSSRRFCKRVGLLVSGNEAFLVPNKFKY